MRSTLHRAAPVLVGLLVLVLGGVAMRVVGTPVLMWIFSRLGMRVFFVGFGSPPPLPILGRAETVIIAVAMLAVVAVPAHRLGDARKIAIVGLLCLAAIVTPTPDPFILAYVWAPLYLLFEVVLLLMRITRPWRRAPA